MNQVTLARQYDPGAETVFADRAVTERFLVNLLSNAIKFSKPESTITVRIKSSESDNVAFSVSDQGRGIAKEWADKVFDKFEQEDLAKSAGRSGTGLGLSFCRLAAEAQGGRIWLESEVDVGTTMTFTLPRTGTGDLKRKTAKDAEEFVKAGELSLRSTTLFGDLSTRQFARSF